MEAAAASAAEEGDAQRCSPAPHHFLTTTRTHLMWPVATPHVWHPKLPNNLIPLESHESISLHSPAYRPSACTAQRLPAAPTTCSWALRLAGVSIYRLPPCMCQREAADSPHAPYLLHLLFHARVEARERPPSGGTAGGGSDGGGRAQCAGCLLYTSDAADDTPC
eukprot:2930260-Pyramimonas_sp.AAC.1